MCLKLIKPQFMFKIGSKIPNDNTTIKYFIQHYNLFFFVIMPSIGITSQREGIQNIDFSSAV